MVCNTTLLKIYRQHVCIFILQKNSPCLDTYYNGARQGRPVLAPLLANFFCQMFQYLNLFFFRLENDLVCNLYCSRRRPDHTTTIFFQVVLSHNLNHNIIYMFWRTNI